MVRERLNHGLGGLPMLLLWLVILVGGVALTILNAAPRRFPFEFPVTIVTLLFVAGLAVVVLFLARRGGMGRAHGNTHTYPRLADIIGFVPRRIAEWLQVWALRDQGTERDRAAVRFTRNPASLLRALEKLDADTSEVGHVTRATAPLWIEFPARVLAGSPTRATRRLSQSLLLDERIDALRALAHLDSSPAP